MNRTFTEEGNEWGVCVCVCVYKILFSTDRNTIKNHNEKPTQTQELESEFLKLWQ